MNKRQTIHDGGADKKRNNVASSSPKGRKLMCGHYVTSHPVAIYPSRRELYNCPVCKKLVKALAR
jgi:hypothetical protein